MLTVSDVRRLLEEHGLRPRKALGQHFVVDPNTVRRIARLSGVGPGDRVVEIGAGLGSLTLALAETGAEVTAVETDGRLVEILGDVVADQPVRVVHADARQLDWNELLGPEAGWHLVANLPYNVATPLVLDLLQGVPTVDHMLVMVQREAGERLAAAPGSRSYGVPSVKCAYYAEVTLAGSVPASVFLPRPAVDSALVALVRRDRPPVDVAPEALFPLVDAGFAGRRKMLRRSLAGLVEPAAFESAHVRPEARAEELSVEDWGRLAAAGS